VANGGLGCVSELTAAPFLIAGWLPRRRRRNRNRSRSHQLLAEGADLSVAGNAMDVFDFESLRLRSHPNCDSSCDYDWDCDADNVMDVLDFESLRPRATPPATPAAAATGTSLWCPLQRKGPTGCPCSLSQPAPVGVGDADADADADAVGVGVGDADADADADAGSNS
jgi:hypothetical protein